MIDEVLGSMTEIERAVQWFDNRLKNTPMPAAREAYTAALAALKEKLARESGKTNGDRIRRMKDEELAKTIVSTDWCVGCPHNGSRRCGDPDACVEGGRIWLNQS